MASTPADDPRYQLVRCAEAVAKLANHRKIEAVPVRFVTHDLEIRPVLSTIVRRWTPLTPQRFISTGAANTPETKQILEHVVPVRVLVDRMIMNPSECRALLDTAVIIAKVMPEEHKRLGHLFPHNKELYERMLAAPVSQLPALGKERYVKKKIRLQPDG